MKEKYLTSRYSLQKQHICQPEAKIRQICPRNINEKELIKLLTTAWCQLSVTQPSVKRALLKALRIRAVKPARAKIIPTKSCIFHADNLQQALKNNKDLILTFPALVSGREELWRVLPEEDSPLSGGIEAPAGFPSSPRCNLQTSAPAAAQRLFVHQQDKTGRKLLGLINFSLLYLLVAHPLSMGSASSGNKGCDLLTKEMLNTPR